MAHGHGHDPLSVPAPTVPFVEAVKAPKASKRVAYTPDLNLSLVDPDVAEICRRGAHTFAGHGATVSEERPDFSGGLEAFQTLRALLVASVRGDLLETDRDRVAPEIIWNIEKGQNVTADEVLQAERARAAIFHNVANFFETHDILACPTVAVPPYPGEHRFPTRIGDQELTTYIDRLFPFVITPTGCPAIWAPCGTTREGLPVGLQLIGKPKGDFDLLSAAQLLESELGFADRMPIRPRKCPQERISKMIKGIPRASVSMVERYLPDAFMLVLVLSLVVFGTGMLVKGHGPVAMAEFWGDGLWNLLSFFMQMVLILVSGFVVASMPVSKRLLQALAKLARSPGQGIVMVTVVSLIAAWVNWGFGLPIGALFARELARCLPNLDCLLAIASA